MDEDSVEYWKEKYEDLNAQYDDFQKSSQEYEHELEVQLKHSETQIKEFSSRNNRMASENETLKVLELDMLVFIVGSLIEMNFFSRQKSKTSTFQRIFYRKSWQNSRQLRKKCKNI